jgi:hypothetical protein
MDRADAVEAAILDHGPVGEDAPEGAILTGWVLVCEWAHQEGGSQGSRWVDTSSPEAQGTALAVGLCRLGEDLAKGD